MLRVASCRSLRCLARLATSSPKLTNTPQLPVVLHAAPLSSVPTHTDTSDYSCTNPETLKDEPWTWIEDWDCAWYDGRDKLHVKVAATKDSTAWRGLGFYSKEGYWMGAVRWNERLRGEDPAVWLHWVGKDAMEICNTLPPPDSEGNYTFTVGFDQREFVMHCNGQLLGVRKNMLYQYSNVGRVWWADLESLNAHFKIEGPHTDDSGYSTYPDVPWFQKTKDIWRTMRKIQKESAESQYPDHGWRSS